MLDDGDCGAIDGMKIGRGNRITRRRPAPALLCLPHEQTWIRTRAAAMGSQWLTAWAMVRPILFLFLSSTILGYLVKRWIYLLYSLTHTNRNALTNKLRNANSNEHVRALMNGRYSCSLSGQASSYWFYCVKVHLSTHNQTSCFLQRQDLGIFTFYSSCNHTALRHSD
jgi:hypothetical protein